MRVLLALALMSISCSTPIVQEPNTSSVQNREQLTLQIPEAGWVPNFFGIINERTQSAKLDDLKSQVLADDDLEIRVWSGFGASKLQGFVLKRTSGQWSAVHVPPIKRNDHGSHSGVSVTPKSGWERLWKSLTDYGILTLPDSSQLQGDDKFITDGISYVVEINMNKTYRTYMYGNPEEQNIPEAKRMVNIINVLFEEFGSGS